MRRASLFVISVLSLSIGSAIASDPRIVPKQLAGPPRSLR